MADEVFMLEGIEFADRSTDGAAVEFLDMIPDDEDLFATHNHGQHIKPSDDEFTLDTFEMKADEDPIDAKDAQNSRENDASSPHPPPPKRARASRKSTMLASENDALILDDDYTPKKPELNPDGSTATYQPGQFGRYGRDKRDPMAAYHRPVSHILDSDDKLMLDMRYQGYSDREIAAKLAKEGNTRYDDKSISTRVARLRQAQAENFDQLLEDGEKEWSYENDRTLMQAFALADIEVSYEIERARASRFRKVAEYMRRLDGDSLYSAKACVERYREITNGTARIPTAMDDDPEEARADLDIFRFARKAARAEELKVKEEEEASKQKIQDQLMAQRARKAADQANKRAQKEIENAERANKLAKKAQARANAAKKSQNAVAERNAKLEKEKATKKRKAEVKKEGEAEVHGKKRKAPKTKNTE